MEASRRRRVLNSASEVPLALVEEIAEDMAARMHASAEARLCAGLSFAYVITDRRLPRYRYAVGDGGAVYLTRDDHSPSSFVFTGDVDSFDAVLRGHANPIKAILTGRVHLHGSLWHVRQLLRMMPAVERAYTEARTAMLRRHEHRYDFRF